jgi:vacuolar-type H+-ATPase subunit I/STV1
MPTLDDKIEALQAKLKQAKALKSKQEAQAKAKLSKEERVRDTRRKILAGSLLLESWEKNQEAKAQWLAKLDKYLTREADRALFDFSPPPEPQQEPVYSTYPSYQQPDQNPPSC